MGFDYAACGHIHKMQSLSTTVWYAGSVDRVDFDEEADVKCALDVRVAPGALVVSMLRTPARRYVTLAPADDADWEPGVVYRFKATDATPAEADTVRKRVGALASDGVWATASVRVASVCRARDAAATADESASDLLVRWLIANPSHVDDLAAQHGASCDDVRRDLHLLSQSMTGE